MEKARSGKDHVIWKLKNVLRGHAMIITEGTYISDQERKEQMEAIENIMNFLNNYDKDIAILKQLREPKTDEEMDRIEKEDMGYGGMEL